MKILRNQCSQISRSVQPVGDVAILSKYYQAQIHNDRMSAHLPTPLRSWQSGIGPSDRIKAGGISAPAADTHSIIVTSSRLSLFKRYLCLRLPIKKKF